MCIKNKVLGFTLIELMIAVAIIAITSALAVPAYQNYVVRAKVTEGLSYMNRYKNEIMEYFSSTGRFPVAISNLTSNNDTSTYVESIEVHGGGLIYLKYKSIANYPNNMLFMQPQVNSTNGSVTWVCANKLNNTTSLSDSYVPSNCRNNISFTFSQGGYNFNTTIPPVGSSVAMVLNPDNNSFEPIGNYINSPISTSDCSDNLSLDDGTYQNNNNYGSGSANSSPDCNVYPRPNQTQSVTHTYITTGACTLVSSTPHLNASGATVSTTRNYTCACVTNTGSVNTLGQENYSGGNPSGLCKSGSSYSPACTGGSVSSFVPYDATTHDSCTRSYSTTS